MRRCLATRERLHGRHPGLLASITVALAIAACSDARIEIADGPIELGAGRFTLDVADDGRTITLRRDRGVLLTLDERAFEVGIVPDLPQDRSWDPWEIERRGEADSDVVF